MHRCFASIPPSPSHPSSSPHWRRPKEPGTPLASTYWRWRLTWNPFAIYQPASSSVGMYQMTDAAFAEARRYCIRHHTVVEEGCPFIGLDSRVLPSRAIELTAVYLDRNVTTILAQRRKATASLQQ